MEELLPVGSIVGLKDESIYIVIGYSPNNINNSSQYDYVGSTLIGLYKSQEQLRYNKDYFYFNKADIERVLFIGYSDEYFELYRMVNEELSDLLKKAKNSKNNLENEDIKKIYENYISKYRNGKGEKDEK